MASFIPYVIALILAVNTEYLEDPRESPTKSLEEIIKKVNESVTFKCPKEIEIEWRFRNAHNTIKHMSESQILEVKNLTVPDEGLYECYSQGQLEYTYNLTIHELPYFTKRMQQLVVKPAGKMIQLKCRAGGNPQPNVVWLKAGKPIRRALGEIKISHWTLTLEELITDDEGNYTCNVCNLAGCIDFTFHVDVVDRFPHKPYTKDGYPKNVTALVNSTVRFECLQLVDDLEPYIQWIYFNSSYKFQEEDGFSGIMQIGNAVEPEILEIRNVTHDDEGWYVCVAANSLGQTVSKAYLTVVDSIEDFSSSALQCYQCSGNNTQCPKKTTDKKIANFTKQVCNGSLAQICVKYSVDLPNGESITYRSCEPPHVGGTEKNRPEFCSFITTLLTPLADRKLVNNVTCKTCNTDNCNI